VDVSDPTYKGSKLAMPEFPQRELGDFSDPTYSLPQNKVHEAKVTLNKLGLICFGGRI
jgi:hypothetical protein